MSRDNDDPDSYEKGKEIFIRCCSCCHSIDNKQHKIGRHKAILTSGEEFNDNTIHDVLNKHYKYVPGTKVLFAGLEKKQSERQHLINYLKHFVSVK